MFSCSVVFDESVVLMDINYIAFRNFRTFLFDSHVLCVAVCLNTAKY